MEDVSITICELSGLSLASHFDHCLTSPISLELLDPCRGTVSMKCSGQDLESSSSG